MNEAITVARSEYIIFLDGDTVPHERFVADHLALAARAGLCRASRAGGGAGGGGIREGRACRWLGALLSGQLSGAANVFRWPFALKSKRDDLRGIRGRNLAMWRSDFVQVNGYNEAFTGWGREDAELAARLMNSGVQRMDALADARCVIIYGIRPLTVLPDDERHVARGGGSGTAAALRGGIGRPF